MSGIEVVGLLASASQLALYSIRIITCVSEIIQKVQDAPARIRQHSDQIRQLVSTAQLIEQHHLLQTVQVHAHIKATLEQAKTLSATLEQLTKDYSRGPIRRYWKILKATKEKEILANFDRLETEKSALLLCISLAQVDLLGQGIHKLEMAEKEARQRSTVAEEGDREDNQIYTANNNAANEERKMPATSLRQGSNGMYASSDQTQIGQVPFNDVAEEVHRGPAEPQGPSGQSHEPSSSGLHHIYEDVTSYDSARQINADLLSEHAASPGPKHHYKRVRAEGLSQQVNGNVGSVEYLKAFLAPRYHQEVALRGYVFTSVYDGWTAL